MNKLILLLSAIAVTACATSHDTWQEAFADYDDNGCQASMWNNQQASYCLSYISARYCDERFGLSQSWKKQGTRTQSWIACAQDRYDYLLAQHNAQKQARGAAISQSGQALMNSSSPSSSASTSAGTIGQLTGEFTSGTNKICYYNVAGSTHTKNVGATELCPLMVSF
jgi:hypothetical protein